MRWRSRRRKLYERDPFVKVCPECGGLHFGSYGCPYAQTICDVCDKTLLRHEGRMFCVGGKTKHDPTSKFCTCAQCVNDRMKFKESLKRDAETKR